MHILVVEDDRFFQNRVIKALRKTLPTAKIDLAESAAEADEKLGREAYDLIVADLILPDNDGEYVTRLAKEGHRVIVMTGQIDRTLRENLYGLDIVDYIYKGYGDCVGYLCHLMERIKKNGRRRVMIVDDSKTMQHLFTKMLKPQGLEVVTAPDGRRALEFLQNERVDLILSDYDMPGLNGIDFLLEVRKRYSMVELPFIAVSSNEEKDIVASFLKQGANDFLRKPFSKEEMLCRINNTLDMLDMTEQIRRHATTDALTGLGNRHLFYEIGPKLVAAARRYDDQPLSLAVFDIDYFKKINDTYGHLMGDRVLREVAATFINNIRASDTAVRYGGEEFVVLMPHTDAKRAFIVSEKLRRLVEGLHVYDDEGNALKVTVSGGVAQLQEGESLDSLVSRADKALYRAKEEGRNRVEMA